MKIDMPLLIASQTGKWAGAVLNPTETRILFGGL